MSNLVVSLIALLVCCMIYLLFRVCTLRKIVDHYKYEDKWAWPQYEKSGSWKEYNGKMGLLYYIKCLEYQHKLLGKILTNKIYHHVGHPFNERNLVIRTVLRDLKLLFNQQAKCKKFKKLENEAKYVNTFWRKL